MEESPKTLSWQKLYPEKAAEHSRLYYHKQLEQDPNFRAKLAERTRARRLRLKMEQGLDITPKTKGRPKKDKPEDQPPQKPCGRPRKYV